MLILLVLPPIASFIFYQIHKRSTRYRIRMEKAWKIVLGEWFLTVALFILYNYSSSLIAICLFSNASGFQFYASIVELTLISGILGLLLWIFVTKDHNWMGEYKENFNWNVFSGLYYLIPIAQRFFVGILLTAASMSYISGIVAVSLLIICIVVVAVKKPFVDNSENARSIVTNIYGIMILSLYIGLSIKGPSHGESIFTYFPYGVIGIVGANVLTGLGFTVFRFVKHSRAQMN